jgi:hypothetical protein
MRYTVDMASGGIIYVPSFMKIGTDVQAIFTFGFSNLKGCNAGITDGRFINYSVEMMLGAMMYIPSCIKTGSGT